MKGGILVSCVLLLASCRLFEPKVSLEGTLWSASESTAEVGLTPVHYKYAEKRRQFVRIDPNGGFKTTFTFEPDDELAWLKNSDFSTPVLLRNGSSLTVRQRADRPELFDISGYDRDWQSVYNTYFEEDRRMLNAIKNERPRYRAGKTEETTGIYKTRVHLAKSHLAGTPYEYYVRKTIGEYLVARLRALEVQPVSNPSIADSVRNDILREAAGFDFFSMASLRAQRAGIRDFTDAWALSFGVKDSLERNLGKKLMAYDVKRLGYKTMDQQRRWVVSLISDPSARAWSEMHLVLERLSESPFSEAERSYQDFVKEYKKYPEYTALAGTLYNDIRKVAPGSPAKPFFLPDASGKMISLDSYKGRYVLLDFWAQWCSPCLEEFPHMKRLYSEFTRDELEIIAIGLDIDKAVWKQAIRAHDNPWIQVYGGREFENELFKAYRGGGIPFYILIAPDGKIARYNDVRPSFNLEAVLNAALGRSLAEAGTH